MTSLILQTKHLSIDMQLPATPTMGMYRRSKDMCCSNISVQWKLYITAHVHTYHSSCIQRTRKAIKSIKKHFHIEPHRISSEFKHSLTISLSTIHKEFDDFLISHLHRCLPNNHTVRLCRRFNNIEHSIDQRIQFRILL